MPKLTLIIELQLVFSYYCRSIPWYMYIEQFYTGCLAEAAYYVESGGEAVIIDPMREPQPYIDLAARRGVVIRYVFETHFHADFVSGHLDLARKTGAEIVFGPGAKADYEFHEAADGEEIKFGFITLKVLHTPGHTAESSCFLLLDERHNPHSVFTGDTLFVDEVGRPDIAGDSNLNSSHNAGILYDSIESKLMVLPNYVVVYPGHGAGSACGKSIGTELYSTIGLQKQSNYALRANSRNEFMQLVTEGQNERPAYFSRVASFNRKSYKNLDAVLDTSLHAIGVADLKGVLKTENLLVIDTRSLENFEKGFIPGALFIGLNGYFEFNAASVITQESKLIVVADAGRAKEVILRLARVGLENVLGYLDGGFTAWLQSAEPVDEISTISAEELEARFRYNSCTALDVRNQDEWVSGFVAGAKLIALSRLETHLNEIDANKSCFVYSASGSRSMVAASILKRNGFNKVVNIQGGLAKIIKTTLPIKQLTFSVS